jgi:UPF0271 protein
MKLNCDIGESFGIWKMGLDSEIMPLIDMANIACGFHASDPLNIDKTVKLAVAENVEIGAHIGYQDLIGFGRRDIAYSPKELEAIVIYQIGALRAFANSNGQDITYIKPHGAMYNLAVRDEGVFKIIADAIYKYDRDLKLMTLSSPKTVNYENISKVGLIFEVFADRGYNSNGTLLARGEQGAIIKDISKIRERVKLLKEKSLIITEDGQEIKVRADTICLHSDTKESLNIAKVIRETLDS